MGNSERETDDDARVLSLRWSSSKGARGLRPAVDRLDTDGRYPVTMRAALLVFGLVLGACTPSWPEGLALDAPTQGELPSSTPESFRWNDHTFTPLARYTLKGLVLAKMRYRMDRLAEVSQTDLALGWGVMSDARVLSRLRIRQNDRYWFWGFQGEAPAPVDEIQSSAANTHIITSDPEVRRVIDRADTGDVVELDGALVLVKGDDGFEAKSSTLRDDKGGGACEIFWVERARRVPLEELQ
jgi:hypothetical protein